jgi:hypothetical protein
MQRVEIPKPRLAGDVGSNEMTLELCQRLFDGHGIRESGWHDALLFAWVVDDSQSSCSLRANDLVLCVDLVDSFARRPNRCCRSEVCADADWIGALSAEKASHRWRLGPGGNTHALVGESSHPFSSFDGGLKANPRLFLGIMRRHGHCSPGRCSQSKRGVSYASDAREPCNVFEIACRT